MTNLAGFRRGRTPVVIAAVLLATPLIPGALSATAAPSSPSPSPEVTLHAPAHAPSTRARRALVAVALSPGPAARPRPCAVHQCDRGRRTRHLRQHRRGRRGVAPTVGRCPRLGGG